MYRKKAILAALILIVLLAYGNNLFPLEGKKGQERRGRPIQVSDILSWRGMSFAALSNDGQWFAYTVGSRDGYRGFVVKKLYGEKKYKYDFSASNISFSGDSKWIAFIIKPKEDKGTKQLKNKLGFLNLGTGQKTEFDNAKKYAFSPVTSTWLAVHTDSLENSKKTNGPDLVLYELRTSKKQIISDVSEFAFNKTGQWLAWIYDAKDKSLNGVKLRNMNTGDVLSLDNDSAKYEKLTWNDNGDAFAVLKGRENKKYENKSYSVVGFNNLSNGSPAKIVYDPLQDKKFPEEMTISPHRRPAWTENLDGIFFGIHHLKRKKEKADEEKVPDLIIWHWLDKRLQSRQQIEEELDRNIYYLCIYRTEEDKFIQLTDENVSDTHRAGNRKEIIPDPKKEWIIGFDQSKYLYKSTMDGRVYFDIYVIDIRTGQKSLAVKKCRKFRRPNWFYTSSPDGTHFLYYNNKDAHFYVYEMKTGKKYNLTQNLPTSFINKDISYNQLNPVIRPFGWSKDSQFVLLSDNYDVWKVPAHGGKGINLTVIGKKKGIRFLRYYLTDYDKRNELLPDEDGIDLSMPIYFEAYGDWTKKEGIARIDKDKTGVKMLLWDDAIFSLLFEVGQSKEFIYSKTSYNDQAYYLTDDSFQSHRKILSHSSQFEKLLWSSGRTIVNYKSPKGERLQAGLLLPANYQKGKSYPTIVDVYEKNSPKINRFYTPSSWFSRAVFNSHGYAILAPDIVYELNNSGICAVKCILAAVEAAVETGIVDRNRLGITGHSWGGYETAFIITQTDIFKAAVAGAPLINLFGLYNSIYGATGDANQRYFESSQDRAKGPYWQYFDDYYRNSPVFFAPNVKTPLMILHNDKDKAVDFHQGIEYFNALRFLQKPVILLQYKGEGHALRKFKNSLDYGMRMLEFFDHYVRGKPAPEWIQKGIPYLERQEHLEKQANQYFEKKSQ